MKPHYDMLYYCSLPLNVQIFLLDSSDTTATSIKNIEENIKQIVENHSLLVGKQKETIIQYIVKQFSIVKMHICKRAAFGDIQIHSIRTN